MELDVAASCISPVEDVCVTTWKRGVAEKVEEELTLFLFLEIKALVGRMHLTEYWVRTVGLRLELGRGLGSLIG